jgi:hypothetical protein
MSDATAKIAASGPPRRPPSQPAATPAAPTVHFRQRAARSGFTQVPNLILDSQRLSPLAKLTYTLLCRHAWSADHAWPHQKGLSGRMQRSVKTLQRAIKELRFYGLLTVEKRGFQLPNIYWIEPLDEFAQEEVEWGAMPGDEPDSPPAPNATQVSPLDTTPASPLDATPASPLDATPASRPIHRRKKTQVKEDTHRVCVVATAPGDDAAPPSPGLAVARLNDAGLSQPVAKRLVEKYGAAACTQQVDWLPLRKAHDKAATLRRAIEERWLAPDGNPKLRLPGERPYTPLAPPPLPEIGPESDAAKLKFRALLAAKGLARPLEGDGHD